MKENFSVMGGWLIPISRVMQANNIDVDQAMADCAVDPALMQHQESRVASRKLTRLIHFLNERLPQADASVQIATQLHPGVFHALGYAMMSSNTLTDALTRVARYKRVVSNTCTLDIKEGPDSLEFVMHVSCYAATAEPVLNQAAVEVFLATIIQFARRLVNVSLRPTRCYLSYADKGKDMGYLRDYMGCEIEFGAENSGLSFALEDANKPLNYANPLITQAHERLLDRLMVKINKNDLSHLVKTKIYELLPLGTPSQAEVAESIGMSLRNLQRKLNEQGTSYKEILETTRKNLTMDYIRENELSLTEISYLVGFSSVGNFNRAFKRWTDATPGEYRKSLQV